MRELVFEVTPDKVDGGFTARAIGESIFTQGDTWEDLCAMVRDATICHFGEESSQISIRLHVPDEVLTAA